MAANVAVHPILPARRGNWIRRLGWRGLSGSRFHDALGKDHSVESPILEHPDIERLETKAMRPPPD